MVFEDLSNKEQGAVILAVGLAAVVFFSSILVSIYGDNSETIEIKVFDVDYMDIGGQTGNTIVMTWFEGKYYFQGNWTNQFELDHTYRIYYVRPASARARRDLVVMEWEDITDLGGG